MSASSLGGIFVLLSFSVIQCFADPPQHPACAGLMQISPSRLVVRYGAPASALCTITQDALEPYLFSWEVAMLHTLIPGPRNKTLKVDKVDQWDTAPQCYSTFLNLSEVIQCNTRLNVTVYQPPDSIQLLAEMKGDMVEGREYTVNCSIENVAPIQKLKVRFYRGDTLLDTQVHPGTTELKPQSADFLLTVTARGEDDGSEVWCEASLDLEDTPVNKSAGVRTRVLYRPRIQTTHLDSKQPVSITEGDTLELNCTAQANPAPSYSWTLPQGLGDALNTAVLILPHVKHTGNYTCTVWNSQGTDAITYLVEVKVDWLPIIAGLVGAVIFVVIVIGCFIFKAHYNQTRTGRYDLRNIFQSLKGASNHVALSNGSLM